MKSRKLHFEATWLCLGLPGKIKNAERVAVDLSNSRKCEDSMGQVFWNRLGNPPTHPLISTNISTTQSSDIEGFTGISRD